MSLNKNYTLCLKKTNLLCTAEADWSSKDVEGNTALHLCMSGRRTNELVSVSIS